MQALAGALSLQSMGWDWIAMTRNGRRKAYEYVDEHVVQVHGYRDRCSNRCFRQWLNASGYHHVSPGPALQSHKRHPNSRIFTLQRVGIGPNAYYNVVETETQVFTSAVTEMHQQQARELATRWMNEAIDRMGPLVKRRKRAQQLYDIASAEMQAVAVLLSVRLNGLNDDEEDEGI